MIALQSVSNIGMCLALLPAMGVTPALLQRGWVLGGLHVPGLRPGAGGYMRRKESDGMRLKRKQPLRFFYKQLKDI